VGFAAEAGQTYYIQAGSLGIAGGEVPSADVRVDIQSVTPPACPGATQQWSDETGDTFTYDEFGNDGIPAPDAKADVVRLTAGSSRDWACVTFEFAQPIPPAPSLEGAISIAAYIDTDRNAGTGYWYLPEGAPFCTSGGVGADAMVYASNTSNLIAYLYQDNETVPFAAPAAAPSPEFAFQTTSGNTLTIALPVSGVGGDASLDVVALASDYEGFDCVPDHTVVHEQPSIIAPFGDANCDDHVDVGDGVEVLRVVAGVAEAEYDGCPPIGFALPGLYAADAGPRLAGDFDCDSEVTAFDALRVVQASSGTAAQVAGCPALGAAPAGG
jgi:hypothetical protein